jgi:anti-anti-sigma factor
MSKLNVHNEETNSEYVYFELEGMLDAHNFETLENLFDKHFEKGNHRFVVDIRRLEYISSAGAGVFIGAVGTCQDHDGNIVLVQPSPDVKEIFEMLGVFQIFPVVPDREQANDVFAQTTS